MNLTRLLQLRKDQVAVSVFQKDEDGQILLSVDKGPVNLKSKGPFLSEKEFGDVFELMQEYIDTDAKLFYPEQKTTPVLPAAVATREAAQEIERAIKSVTKKDAIKKKATITVLPCILKFTYLHTCTRCRCHNVSYLRVGPMTTLRLCSNCNHILAASY